MLTAYKRIHWFNSDFHSGFVLNDNQKITEISFDVNPFQIDINNNLKVVTYVREATQSKPIQIKLKEPYNQSKEVFNDDNEAFPIIYTNHTGTESMNALALASGTYYPYSIARLIPQQIPRFTFRVDDNYGLFLGNNYFTSITNGETLPVIKGSPNEKFIIFKSSGSFTLTDKMVIDILVVGGGGGGGSGHGGGGGAGAVIYKTNYNLSSGSYTVTIGAGGSGGAAGGGAGDGTNGVDTTITNGALTIFRAKGGGKGVRVGSGGVGGSGGGAGGSGGGVSTISNDNIPQDTDVFGFAGGSSTGSYIDSGGGGGAGGVGANGSGNNSGNGGSGKQISITGTPVFYAGGGGGGGSTPNGIGGTGGAGGGGTGGSAGGNGTSAIANTGSGGGGAGFNDSVPIIGAAGAGGSGVVIIRYTEIRKRIEGITPDETLIQATNTNIPITIDSQYQINYQTPTVLPKGTYESIFNNGTITFKSKPDYSYPTTSNIPIAWYKFDTNSLILDSSGNGCNLININSTLNTNNYKRGNSSASFDGNGDYFLINNLNLNNKSFSISVWSYLTDTSKICGFFGTDSTSGTTRDNMHIQYVPPAFGIGIYFNLFADDLAYTGITTASELNTWNNYVFILNNDVNPKTTTIYRNGIQVATKNLSGAFISNTNNYRIGQTFQDNPKSWSGQFDDFRIFDYALSQAEVYDLYNGNTDRSYPILKDANGANINPLVWYQFDINGLLVDSSGNNYTLTNNNGVAINSNIYVRGNGSSSFIKESNQYLSLPTSINFNSINIATGLSFSLWFRISSYDYFAAFLSIGNTANPNDGIASTLINIQMGDTDSLYVQTLNAGVYSTFTYSLPGVTTNNNWYHVVWTISTTGVWNIYLNGVVVLLNSQRAVVPIITSTNRQFWIGKNAFSDIRRNITGNVDDLRIYSQVLTAAQVTELYNGRLAIYNPPGFILGTEIEPE